MAQIQHTNSTVAKHSIQWLRPVENIVINAISNNTHSGDRGFSGEKDYPHIEPFYNKLR